MATSENKPENISTKVRKKQMLAALEASLGVVHSACIAVGIERKTHYRWLDADPKYKAAVEEMANIALDFAESKLHQQIKSNNTSATIFYLKTKGKKRGYVERTEITGPDGKEITGNTTNYILPDGTEIKI